MLAYIRGQYAAIVFADGKEPFIERKDIEETKVGQSSSGVRIATRLVFAYENVAASSQNVYFGFRCQETNYDGHPWSSGMFFYFSVLFRTELSWFNANAMYVLYIEKYLWN